MSVVIKNQAEIAAMRQAGRIVAQALAYLAAQIKPGMKTAELEVLAADFLADKGASASFKGYNGFPASLCVSVNDQVVHGLPGDQVISKGDLVGLDLGATWEGLIADGATTVAIGTVGSEAQRLLEGTQAALAAGIRAARAGNRVGDISSAVEAVLREFNLGVIEDLSGHGVGRKLHEPPSVPNFGRAGEGAELKPGMTLAIEPMATLGGKDVELATDQNTIVTADGSLAAQFEHTVLITPGDPEILTRI
jgi:methionyl aminopeptidase